MLEVDGVELEVGSIVASLGGYGVDIQK